MQFYFGKIITIYFILFKNDDKINSLKLVSDGLFTIANGGESEAAQCQRFLIEEYPLFALLKSSGM